MRGTCLGAPTYLEEVYNTCLLGGTYLLYLEEVRNGGTATYLLRERNAT